MSKSKLSRWRVAQENDSENKPWYYPERRTWLFGWSRPWENHVTLDVSVSVRFRSLGDARDWIARRERGRVVAYHDA